jgi:orotidine-5'-phosphate decarboxylase
VTLLTSLDEQDPPPGFRRPLAVAQVAAEMLALAEQAGARGIVCSARDLPELRRLHGRPFYAVTPGIRPAGGERHDQRRVATVSEAVRWGSSLLVMGRAITAASDPHAALVAARGECRAAVAAIRPVFPPA